MAPIKIDSYLTSPYIINISNLEFSQIEVASKDFHKQRQIFDIFTIDVNKVMLSDKVPCNNGNDGRYIVGYEIRGETVTSLFIKTPKNIFSYGVSQFDKNSAYTKSFNVSEAPEQVLKYGNIWNDVEPQIFEKLTTEPIRVEGKYMHINLKK